ncbi:hypothetical protein ACFL5Q_06190 [Planctomycetota bacterium]
MEPQETSPRFGGAGVVSVGILAVDVVTLAVLGLCMTYARARIGAMFEEFGVELPAMTQLLLSVPTGVVVLVLVGAGALLVAKEGMVRKASVRLTLNLLAALGLLAFAALVVVALFLPLMSLMHSLS